jgi:quercetin dioxygenase-like cupin family protein
MNKGQSFNLRDTVNYQEDSIVSKKVLENAAGGITLFAFDQDQRLSEHTAPFDATVQVLEGEAEILIDGQPHVVKAGEMIVMPAKITHAVNARQRFKMMLMMIRA